MSERFKFLVSVSSDNVPGWGQSATDWKKWIQRLLDSQVPHYAPMVEDAPEPTKKYYTVGFALEGSWSTQHVDWEGYAESLEEAQSTAMHYWRTLMPNCLNGCAGCNGDGVDIHLVSITIGQRTANRS